MGIPGKVPEKAVFGSWVYVPILPLDSETPERIDPLKEKPLAKISMKQYLELVVK